MKKSDLRKMAEEMFNHGLIICKYDFKEQKERNVDASVIICIDDSLFGPCKYFETKEEMIKLLKDLIIASTITVTKEQIKSITGSYPSKEDEDFLIDKSEKTVRIKVIDYVKSVEMMRSRLSTGASLDFMLKCLGV